MPVHCDANIIMGQSTKIFMGLKNIGLINRLSISIIFWHDIYLLRLIMGKFTLCLFAYGGRFVSILNQLLQQKS